MPSRELSFPVFDADNHMYEPQEALTKFLPDKRKRVIDYVQVRGRTKIVVRGHISEYIPNPTFEVVARPGAQEEYFRHGSGGKSYREVLGEPMKAIPAFREPGPRLEVMDELGVDYALMFPTLASLVEERMKDDPEMTHDVIHALNQWMHETWTFNYKERIFATPVITLPIVDRALEELEWCLERGARTVLVRPAPVPGYRGSRSFGLKEFDPFWQACIKAGIPVSMHASDSGYSELLNVWEPGDEFLPFKPTAFRSLAMGHRPIEDAMGALVCHGALSRNPELRILSIENGADWVPHLFKGLKGVYKKMPQRVRRRPDRGVQAVRLRQPVLGGPVHRDRQHGGHRPGGLRIRLAAPRRPEGPHHLRRRTCRLRRRGRRKDHGRQHDGSDEGLKAGLSLTK